MKTDDMPDPQAPPSPSSDEVGTPIGPDIQPIEDTLDRFWEVGPGFEAIEVIVRPPERPLAILERLGPSPFERGGFRLVGFLATIYDKVSRYALDRAGATNADRPTRPTEAP